MTWMKFFGETLLAVLVSASAVGLAFGWAIICQHYDWGLLALFAPLGVGVFLVMVMAMKERGGA